MITLFGLTIGFSSYWNFSNEREWVDGMHRCIRIGFIFVAWQE